VISCVLGNQNKYSCKTEVILNLDSTSIRHCSDQPCEESCAGHVEIHTL
uniref:Uncharacterized protein n=1 Tax=Aegilops tauschii subsp. strangulata TaxID=200361 RepID=A0A453IEG4_AEGTS